MTTAPVQPTALPDYPAAHSGDVTWFAVDTEGSVGVFRASQQSAIPWIDPAERDAVRREVLDRDISVRLVQQEQDSQAYDRSDVLLAAHTECESDVVSREIRSLQLDPVEIGFEVEECLHPWNEDWYGEFHDHDTGTDITALLDRAHLGPWLVWVLDIEAARAELDAGIAGLPPQRRRGSRGVVAFADLPSATARRLLLTGDCLGVKRWRSPLKIMEYRGELTQLGLHAYFVVLRGDDAGEFGWSSHQYLRDLFPAVPLRIERLSERAQRIAGRVRLPISFSESPFLQPELYVPCRRDVSETAFVERDGTPTARLLENRTYLDFLAQRKRERDDPILAAMILAEQALDFPAAHSTDAMWFAVDKDGHVASFQTGGGGHVPPSASFVGEVYENKLSHLPPAEQMVLAGLILGHRATKAILDLKGLVLPAFDEPLHAFSMGKSANLFFLVSADAARMDIDADRACEIPATRGVAVAYRQHWKPSRQLKEHWHRTGACLGCFEHHLGTDGLRTAERGVVTYSDLVYGVQSEPLVYANWYFYEQGALATQVHYGRVALPGVPLLSEELPSKTREAVSQFRFESLCFLETPCVLSFTGDTSWEARCSFHRLWLERTLRRAARAEVRGNLHVMEQYLQDAQRHERMLQKFRISGSREDA